MSPPIPTPPPPPPLANGAPVGHSSLLHGPSVPPPNSGNAASETPAASGAPPRSVTPSVTPSVPSSTKTGPGALPVQALSADAALRSRMAQIKRQRARKWAWLRKIPGYDLVESIWLRFVQVRDAGQVASEEEHRRELPAWLVSFLVHVGLLMAMALIPLAQMASQRMQVLDGVLVEGGQGAIEFTPVPSGNDISLQEIELPMSSLVLNAPDLDFDRQAISSTLSSSRPVDEGVATALDKLSISSGLSGRTGSLKGALLGKFGGNDVTQAAVANGLKWLAYNQLPDGGWSLTKPYNDGAANEDRTAATAMALNAFLGDGHTHKAAGPYQGVVERGLKFLVRRQDKEGFFSAGEPSHNQMYSQALATIAICEAYGMTGDSELRVPATRAIRFAEWSQGRQKGWRYVPRQESDLSVTGWYMMALMTGKMAGLEPNEKVIESIGEYLEDVSHDYGARYSYQRPEPPTLSMTAEGLLCRQYLGWPASHPALQRAIKVDLLPNPPRIEEKFSSVYYWYYATQVLHHVGGEAWAEWNSHMKVVLPELQEKNGGEAGSWSPKRDQFGPSGGRLYTTCFCIYCLEVYYRHLALYDFQPETGDRAPKAASSNLSPLKLPAETERAPEADTQPDRFP